jgi:hypothetical protein
LRRPLKRVACSAETASVPRWGNLGARVRPQLQRVDGRPASVPGQCQGPALRSQCVSPGESPVVRRVRLPTGREMNVHTNSLDMQRLKTLVLTPIRRLCVKVVMVITLVQCVTRTEWGCFCACGCLIV